MVSMALVRDRHHMSEDACSVDTITECSDSKRRHAW